MSNAASSDAPPSAPAIERWALRCIVAAALATVALHLFFGHPIGLSMPLFLLAVAIGVLATNRIAKHRSVALWFGVLILALLPALEDFNPISALIAAFGISSFALGATDALGGNLKQRVTAIVYFLFSGPWRLPVELPRIARPQSLSALRDWSVPLALGAVFVALFAAANPLISDWLTFARPERSALELQRVLFWLFALVLVWPFVCVERRFPLPDPSPVPAAGAAPPEGLVPAGVVLASFFTETAILRSLILFNTLFAVQTALDLHYLWNGAALPHGMSYANYAHRGAYPLIVTALLAAVFVLIAMRPGSAAGRSSTMCALVSLWVAQNVLLVASSILRLQLYVSVYSLTYWRVAAFIWMLVVAAGLLLILIRILTERSNDWLVSANAAVLCGTIYASGLINLPYLVARYNVDHARAMADAGQTLDLAYLASLGPQAIPALDRLISAGTPSNSAWLAHLRARLAADQRTAVADWRGITFRHWRLARWLDARDPP